MASASIPSFYNTSFPRQPTEFSCVLFFCLVLLTMSVCGSVSLGPCCMHTISYAMCSFHVSIPFPLVFDMCDKYHLSSPYMPCLFEAFLSTLFLHHATTAVSCQHLLFASLADRLQATAVIRNSKAIQLQTSLRWLK